MSKPSQETISVNLPPATPVILQAFGEMGAVGYLQAVLDKGISFQFGVQQSRTFEPTAIKFRRLVADWQKNTRYKSSFRRMVLDPSYQRIIMMGESALPFIFQELKDHGGHWFFALETITDNHVGFQEDDFETIRNAWLQWGIDHGYLSA